jgi:hypothetical protein
MQLSLLPRLDVQQTSTEEIGQVYVPQINWLLAVIVIALVLSFRSSDEDQVRRRFSQSNNAGCAGDESTVARLIW